MIKPPEACGVWMRLARREPEFRPLYRWRTRQVLKGLRVLRERENRKYLFKGGA